LDNYADVLGQLRDGGLLVTDLEVSGRVIRRPVDGGGREKRGWYVLHEWRREDGRSLIVGAWGIYRGNDPGTKKIDLRGERLSAEESAALRERLREDRRRAAAARKASARRAARRAEQVWRKASATPPGDVQPEYLRRKGVAGHGVRYTESGAVVLAMHDGAGRVHGLQFLLSRSGHADRIQRTGRDKEYWPAGTQKQGRYFLVGRPSWLVLVCEGYATGASLHEATGLPVAVAFDANNLAPVAQELRNRYRDARLLICADDDFATRGNPGIASASAAALKVAGAFVAPRFAVEDQVALRVDVREGIDWEAEDHRERVGELLRRSPRGKLTDWNDLHQAEGIMPVREQIEAKLLDLGWADPAARDSRSGGEGGDEDDWHFGIDTLLDGYALIYGTDTVFDRTRARIIGLGPLRSVAGKSLVRMWLEHPDRCVVLPEHVGFDPTGTDADVRCNLWSGWPTSPSAGSCERLIELLEYLCNSEPSQGRELSEWLLRWIAYPIQHPGAKMQTAVLMHGPEGTGKNTLFSAVRKIYGRYGTQFSQVELESQFNGWASGKLFAIGNEVVSRSELYHIQGRLKSMITEPEWVINEKMLPARSEQNHCNFVFFSNRIDIAKLDHGDRRYCVIWTPEALTPEFYAEVAAEIRGGGVEALHHYLLHLDLGAFNEHTKPPQTQAKQELVELGMDSTERFFRDWTGGAIGDLPADACRSEDLYAAYRLWASREGLIRMAQKQTLLTAVGKRPGVVKRQERISMTLGWINGNPLTKDEKKMVVFVGGASAGPDDGSSRASWVGRKVGEFAAALAEYRGGAEQ